MITSWAVWVGEKQLCVRLSKEIAIAIAWDIHQDSGQCRTSINGRRPSLHTEIIRRRVHEHRIGFNIVMKCRVCALNVIAKTILVEHIIDGLRPSREIYFQALGWIHSDRIVGDERVGGVLPRKDCVARHCGGA